MPGLHSPSSRWSVWAAERAWLSTPGPCGGGADWRPRGCNDHSETAAAASLARCGNLRPRPAGNTVRRGPRGPGRRACRAHRAGVPRPEFHARRVSGGLLAARHAHGAALQPAQHAGPTDDRAHLAPQRTAPGRTLAHGPHQPRTPAQGDDPLRCGNPARGRRHQFREHARGLCGPRCGRAGAPCRAEDGQRARPPPDRHARRGLGKIRYPCDPPHGPHPSRARLKSALFPHHQGPLHRGHEAGSLADPAAGPAGPHDP